MGRYRDPSEWLPNEVIFFIRWDKPDDKPAIIIHRDGKTTLQKHFLQYSVTVLVEQDAESIDITEAQYATMQRVIDYGMYHNPGLEVYFTQHSTLWGKSPKNFDGMDFHEAMEARFAYP